MNKNSPLIKSYQDVLMSLSIVVILLAITSDLAESKVKNLKCSFENFERSVVNVYGMFGIENVRLPETDKAMNAYCRTVKNSIKSGKKFGENCLKSDQKALLKLQLSSVEKANKEYCKQKSTKRSKFIVWSKCGNSAKTETSKCWKEFVGNVGMISSLNKNDPEIRKNQMNLLCCKYYQWMKCMNDSWIKKDKVCTKDAINGFNDLAMKTSQESLQLVCSQISNQDRDKICYDLNEKIMKNIEKLDEKKLPLTALKFVFQMFE